MSWWELLGAAAGSFVAGYLGAAIGLVLGTLRLPLILLLAGSPSSAAGTNIGISAAAAASGGLGQARAGRVSWRVVAWMTPPSVAGALVGGFFGHDVPKTVLLAGTAAVLAWSGVDLLARPIRPAPADGRLRVTPAILYGFLIGVVGGALGVILGTLRMPALLRAVRLSPAEAVGTNLVVGFALGVVGLIAHAARLEVEWELLAVGVPAALVGAWRGARLTGRISDRALRRAIGAALIAIAVAFAVESAL